MTARQHRTMSVEMDAWLDAQIARAKSKARGELFSITDEELYHLSIG